MRNLAIDIGNSKIKTGLFKGGKLIETQSFETQSFETLTGDSGVAGAGPGTVNAGPHSAFSELTHLIEKYRPEQTIVASVVDLNARLISRLRQHSHLHLFPGELRLPLQNKYRTPETLGADRLAAVIGAAAASPQTSISPRLVIVAGTCITYNFVDRNNRFQGGAISPGLHMRLGAMHTFTGKLPLINLDEGYRNFLGRDTRESMLSGAQEGAVAEVIYMIASYDKQNPGLQVFLCGGDAEFFDKRLKNSIFADRVVLDRDLILKGLDRVLNFQYQ